MLVIPLATVAAQTLTVALAGQACALALYQRGTGAAAQMYMDLAANGAPILSARLVRAYGGLPATRAAFLLSGRHYLGFQGDLVFLDTQASSSVPTEDPQPSGLGARWKLLYLSAADLAASGL